MKVLKAHEITLKTIYEDKTIPTTFQPRHGKVGLQNSVTVGTIEDGSRFSEEKMNSLLALISRFVSDQNEPINRQTSSSEFATHHSAHPKKKLSTDPNAQILRQYISDCEEERERRREALYKKKIESSEGKLANERLDSDRSLFDRLITGSGWYSDSNGRNGFVVSWGSSQGLKEKNKRGMKINGASSAI